MAIADTPDTTLQGLNTATGAAFFTLLWDWVITLDDEVGLIWVKPRGAWVKWLYFFARYYPLGALITARSMEAAVIYHFPLSLSCLKVWYSCQVIVALHAMVALEIVLMTRVYALYNRPRRMRIFFAALVFIENVIVMVGLIVHYPDHTFTPALLAANLPPSFAYFGFCTVGIQITVLYFTLRKYLSGTWKTVPIVELMFRDGTLSFTVLTMFSMTMAVFTVQENPFAVPGYAWLLACISSVTCRLIINIQQLPREDADFTTGIQFTTFLGENHATSTMAVTEDSSHHPTSPSHTLSQDAFDHANANTPESRRSS